MIPVSARLHIAYDVRPRSRKAPGKLINPARGYRIWEARYPKAITHAEPQAGIPTGTVPQDRARAQRNPAYPDGMGADQIAVRGNSRRAIRTADLTRSRDRSRSRRSHRNCGHKTAAIPTFRTRYTRRPTPQTVWITTSDPAPEPAYTLRPVPKRSRKPMHEPMFPAPCGTPLIKCANEPEFLDIVTTHRERSPTRTQRIRTAPYDIPAQTPGAGRPGRRAPRTAVSPVCTVDSFPDHPSRISVTSAPSMRHQEQVFQQGLRLRPRAPGA